MDKLQHYSVAVIGAGRMGHGIAQTCVWQGCYVKVIEIQPEVIETAKRNIDREFTFLKKMGVLDEAAINEGWNRLSWSNQLNEIEGCHVIIESIQEDLAAKQELFARIEKVAGSAAILGTNTSSLPLLEIGKKCQSIERIIGIHWANPPMVVPMIEVVIGPKTSASIIDETVKFVTKIGKVPIICKDSPGFLMNRLKAALVNEAIAIFEEGIASAEAIDEGFRLGFAPRFALYGLLLANDLTGKKSTTLAVTRNIYERLGRPQFKPPRALEAKVEAGDLGIEHGGGWYQFGKGSSEKIKEILNRRDEALFRLYQYLKELENISGLRMLRGGLKDSSQ